METYGKILLIAMPVFLVLALFEKWYGWKKGFETVNTMDMISSLQSGITNVTKDILGLGIGILSYGFLLKHLAVFTIENTLIVYVIAFLVIDFQSYWTHRWQHKINFLWNRHIIHHSSEEFNLACGLRQSISSVINYFGFLLIPAAIIGVPEPVIATIAPIHLFAQFWYHTRHIGKLGFLEKIIVTPSHHRVHHAINPVYLDKNLAAIFIWWDKWFGTFQEELDEVPPVYGITRPAATWNPVKINYQHLWLLIKDAWRTNDLKAKFLIWFKPTGWRPADMEEKFPVPYIKDVFHFEKWNPPYHPKLPAWLWFHLVALLLFLTWYFGNIAAIGAPGIFYYAFFIFLAVYANSELMDRNPNAIWWELAKNAYGISIILFTGDWFNAGADMPWILPVIVSYFIISTPVVFFFCRNIAVEDNRPALA